MRQLVEACLASIGISVGTLVIVAFLLAGCAEPVPPSPGRDVTLIIHVSPAKALVAAGKADGRTGFARPYTYRVESRGGLTCGVVFDDSVLDPTPAALARFSWELRNCEGNGGDFQ